MYKWPQGKVIRMIVLVLALAAAGDLGYAAYVESSLGFVNAEPAEGASAIYWNRIAKCSLYGIVALALLFYGLTSTLFNAKRAQFLIEVEQEAAKVTLPKRSDLVRSTIIISIGTVIMAVVLFVVDLLNQGFLDLVQGLGGA